MKKNKAFTYVELGLALMIVGIVLVILLKTVKPQKMTLNPFFVATYKNLEKVNEELVYQNEQGGGSGLPSDYCTKLSEMITTKSADCTGGVLVLPNGVELSNLSDSLASDSTLDISVKVTNNEKETTHNLIIYQAAGDVTPKGADQSSTELFKYRVFSDETGKYVEATKEGVSFQSAVCLIGSNEKYEIEDSTCEAGNPDTTNCPYPGMCRAEIVMPKGTNFN